MDEFQFTYDRYETLIEQLHGEGLSFVPFGETQSGGYAWLRHDVDFSPRKAVRLAEIEHELGISATYFYRISAPVYNVFTSSVCELVRETAALGHDVGLHFDTHQYWDGQPPAEALRDRIRTERDALAGIVDTVDVIAFHNPPKWTLGDRFDGFEHAYEPRYFQDVVYVADSNQRWRNEPPLADGVPDALQLLTHPILWGETDRSKDDHLREEFEYNEARLREELDGAMLDGSLG